MSAESVVRAELVALLRYANKTAVAKALGVSTQAVINWSEGRNTSPARLAQVRRLYGLGTKKEAPAPDWAEALAAQAAEDVVRRLVPPDLLAAAHRLLAQLAETPLPSDEAEPAERGSQDRVG